MLVECIINYKFYNEDSLILHNQCSIGVLYQNKAYLEYHRNFVAGLVHAFYCTYFCEHSNCHLQDCLIQKTTEIIVLHMIWFIRYESYRMELNKFFQNQIKSEIWMNIKEKSRIYQAILYWDVISEESYR